MFLLLLSSSLCATERAVPSYWLNNWDSDSPVIALWNMASNSWTVAPSYRPGIQSVRAFNQMERNVITDDSFAFDVDGVHYRDPMQMNSSHLGGCVQEPDGELWTEYTHYGKAKLPIVIRRSFYMPPHETFYMVKYQLSSADGSEHTVNLLDFLSSGECNEWGRGACADGSCTVDQQYCYGYGVAVSVDSSHSAKYTVGNGDFSNGDNPLNYFASNGDIPSFSEYNQFTVGIGALYRNLKVKDTVTVVSYRAFGKTLSDAKALLSQVTAKTSTEWAQTTANRYASWLSGGIVPSSLTGDALDLYKKSLLALKNSQYATLGTIASSMHPLYGYKNWMRDSIMGAFMLDAAHFHTEAKRYFDWVPTAPLTYAGAFHTCYNTFTGQKADFVEPQYDSVGLYLIAMNYHLQVFGDEEWVESHLSTIEKFAQWIVDNKGTSNLGPSDRSPWEESSDHHTGAYLPEQYLTWTQGLYYGGLVAAAQIEKRIGSSDRAATYLARAEEIKELTLSLLWNEDESHFYRGRWADTFSPDNRAESTTLSTIFTGMIDGAKALSHYNFIVSSIEHLDGGLARYKDDPYFHDSIYNPCGAGTSETQLNEPVWPVATAYGAWAELALGKDVTRRLDWMLKYAAYGNMPIGEGVDRADGALIVPSSPDSFEHSGVYVYTYLIKLGLAKTILETLQ